jgi:hypothetical protein
VQSCRSPGLHSRVAGPARAGSTDAAPVGARWVTVPAEHEVRTLTLSSAMQATIPIPCIGSGDGVTPHRGRIPPPVAVQPLFTLHGRLGPAAHASGRIRIGAAPRWAASRRGGRLDCEGCLPRARIWSRPWRFARVLPALDQQRLPSPKPQSQRRLPLRLSRVSRRRTSCHPPARHQWRRLPARAQRPLQLRRAHQWRPLRAPDR